MDKARYCRAGQLEIIHLKNKPLVYSEHTHASVYTIGLVLHGRVTLSCKNEHLLYPAGSYFIVAPWQPHALTLPTRYELISLCLHKDLMAALGSEELLSQLSQTLPIFSSTINYHLVAEALEAIRHSPPPLLNKTILPSALTLHRFPEETHGLETMAEKSCYSRYHFIKLFKQSFGITPHKFHTQSRVRKAQRMIEQNQSLTGIALELGFYDQSHFIKCFKKVVGLTPTEYSRACGRPSLNPCP